MEMIKQSQRSKNELSIETGPYKIKQDQDLTNNKKYTIFELSSWNVVKIQANEVVFFDQVL